jgi:predicted nucleic acid-binding protein
VCKRQPTWSQFPELHEGERAAISLARELKADLLLIDESDGRSAALARRLQITGTIGILQRAAEQDLLDLAEAFERVKQTDFWISPKLLDTELAKFREEEINRKS